MVHAFIARVVTIVLHLGCRLQRRTCRHPLLIKGQLRFERNKAPQVLKATDLLLQDSHLDLLRYELGILDDSQLEAIDELVEEMIIDEELFMLQGFAHLLLDLLNFQFLVKILIREVGR